MQEEPGKPLPNGKQIDFLSKVAYDNDLSINITDYLKRADGNHTRALELIMKENKLSADEDFLKGMHDAYGLKYVTPKYFQDNRLSIEERKKTEAEALKLLEKTKNRENEPDYNVRARPFGRDDLSPTAIRHKNEERYQNDVNRLNSIRTLLENDWELQQIMPNAQKVETSKLGPISLKKAKEKMEAKSADDVASALRGKISERDMPTNLNLIDTKIKDEEVEEIKKELDKEYTQEIEPLAAQVAFASVKAEGGDRKESYVKARGLMNDRAAALTRKMEMYLEDYKNSGDEQFLAKAKEVYAKVQEQSLEIARGYEMTEAVEKYAKARTAMIDADAEVNGEGQAFAKAAGRQFIQAWKTYAYSYDEILNKNKSYEQFLKDQETRQKEEIDAQMPAAFRGNPMDRYVDINGQKLLVDQNGEVEGALDDKWRVITGKRAEDPALQAAVNEYNNNQAAYPVHSGLSGHFNWKKTLGSGTTVALNMIPIIATSVVVPAGAGNAVRYLAGIPSSSLMMFHGNFQEQIKLGKGYDQAWKTAGAITFVQSLIEQGIGAEAKLGKQLRTAIDSRVLKQDLDGFIKKGLDMPSVYRRAEAGAADFLKKYGGEFGEEEFQAQVDARFNHIRNGVDIDLDPDRFLNTGLSMFFSVAGMDAITKIATPSDKKRFQNGYIRALMEPEGASEVIDALQSEGGITEKEANIKKAQINASKAEFDAIYNDHGLTNPQKNELIRMIAERDRYKMLSDNIELGPGKERFSEKAREIDEKLQAKWKNDFSEDLDNNEVLDNVTDEDAEGFDREDQPSGEQTTATSDKERFYIKVEKIVPDGENRPLTENEEGLIERIINLSVDGGKSAENIKTNLTAHGFSFNFSDLPTIIAFLQDRVDGKDNRTFKEFASGEKSIKAKEGAATVLTPDAEPEEAGTGREEPAEAGTGREEPAEAGTGRQEPAEAKVLSEPITVQGKEYEFVGVDRDSKKAIKSVRLRDVDGNVKTFKNVEDIQAAIEQKTEIEKAKGKTPEKVIEALEGTQEKGKAKPRGPRKPAWARRWWPGMKVKALETEARMVEEAINEEEAIAEAQRAYVAQEEAQEAAKTEAEKKRVEELRPTVMAEAKVVRDGKSTTVSVIVPDFFKKSEEEILAARDRGEISNMEALAIIQTKAKQEKRKGYTNKELNDTAAADLTAFEAEQVEKRKQTAKRIRQKKADRNTLKLALDLGLTQMVYNGAIEFMAKQVERGTSLGKAIEETVKWIDQRFNGKKWDKERFRVLAESAVVDEGFDETADENKASFKLTDDEIKNVTELKKDDVEKRVVSFKTISTRVPDSIDQPTENVHSRNDLIVTLDETRKTPKAYMGVANDIINHNIINVSTQERNAIKEGLANTAQKGDKNKMMAGMAAADAIYTRFRDHVIHNLLWLHDSIDSETRKVMERWYDGANVIAQEFAKKYGVTPEQVAAVMAALSPQKDWFMNISLAERVLYIVKERGDYVMDEKIAEAMRKIAKEQQINKNKDETKEAFEARKKKKIAKNLREANAAIKRSMGKKLIDSGKDFGMLLRGYDKAFHNPSHYIYSPNGDIIGVAKNTDGKNTKVAWGAYKTINNAISAVLDGSAENISMSLGEEHKVRNFYNNIADPNSDAGHVTMDTHAVAAAYLKALGGNSTEVKQNLGGKGSNVTGISGTYAVLAEAYREAAAARGLLPRQMQSITWEAVRLLFTDSFKREKGTTAKINSIWNDYINGKFNIHETRKRIDEAAKGIKGPSWAGQRSDDGVKERGSLDSRELFITGPVGDGGRAGSRNVGSSKAKVVRPIATEVEEIAYHGTNEDFEDFQVGRKTGAQGRTSKYGVWFTSSKEEASQYAKLAGKRNYQNQEEYDKKIGRLVSASERAEAKGDFKTQERLLAEAERIDAEMRSLKPKEFIREAIMPANMLVHDAVEVFNSDAMDAVIRKAKKDGYNGVKFTNISDSPFGLGKSTTQYIVFDPKNIKKKGIGVSESPLLAPNGKKSNLTPEQYRTVRTPEFKAWFGDWEIANKKWGIDDISDLKRLTDWYANEYIEDKIEPKIEVLNKNEKNIINIKRQLDVLVNKKSVKNSGILPYDYADLIAESRRSLGLPVIKSINELDINELLDALQENIDGVAAQKVILTNLIQKTAQNLILDGRLKNNASKVVDENGEPLVVFHSTSAEFNEFETDGIGGGAWFSDDREGSIRFAKEVKKIKNPITKEVFLNIRNPKEYTDFWNDYLPNNYHSYRQGLRKSSIADSKDGIIIQDDSWHDVGGPDQGAHGKQFVAFFPNQIKLTTNTTFDPGTGDIRLQSDLESDEDFNESVMYDAFDVQEEVESEVIFEALDYKKGDKQHWPKISAARLKRLWNDYVKFGFVRDEKGLNDLVDIIVRNTFRLETNTALMGHKDYDGLKQAASKFELTKRQQNKLKKVFEETDFADDENGQALLSDYATPKLSKIAYKILAARSPEEKLLLADQALNVIHMRGDIAALFVEGGSKTLSELSSAPGETALHAGERRLAPIKEEKLKLLLGRLDRAIPGRLGGVLTGESFVEKAKTKGLELRTSKGKVYGFVEHGKDGKIWLNADHMNSNSPIHEYGHIWIWIMKDAFPEVYKRGLKLANDSDYLLRLLGDTSGNYRDIANDYRNGIKTTLQEEALAMGIGDQGERIANRNKPDLLKWLEEFWEKIKSVFGGKLSDLSVEKLQKLTFNQFANLAAAELLSGDRVTGSVMTREEINEWTKENINRLADDYIKANGKKLDPDEVRLLFEEIGYNGKNVPRYRIAEKMVVNAVYDRLLDEAIKSGNLEITFLTGPGGSGKSTAAKALQLQTAGILFDSAFNSFESLDRPLSKAVARGLNPKVIFVYNGHTTSFKNSVKRGDVSGRFFSLAYFVNAFQSNKDKIDLVFEKYPDIAADFVNNFGNETKVEDKETARGWDYEISESDLFELLNFLRDEIERDPRQDRIAALTADMGDFTGIDKYKTDRIQRLIASITKSVQSIRRSAAQGNLGQDVGERDGGGVRLDQPSGAELAEKNLREEEVKTRDQVNRDRITEASKGLRNAVNNMYLMGAIHNAKTEADKMKALIDSLFRYAIAHGIKAKDDLIALVKDKAGKVLTSSQVKRVSDAVLSHVSDYDNTGLDRKITDELAYRGYDIDSAIQYLESEFRDQNNSNKAAILKYILHLKERKAHNDSFMSPIIATGKNEFLHRLEAKLRQYKDIATQFTNAEITGQYEGIETTMMSPDINSSVVHAAEFLMMQHDQYVNEHGGSTIDFIRAIADYLNTAGSDSIYAETVSNGALYMIEQLKSRASSRVGVTYFRSLINLIKEGQAERRSGLGRALALGTKDRTDLFSNQLSAIDEFKEGTFEDLSDEDMDEDNHQEIINIVRAIKRQGEAKRKNRKVDSSVKTKASKALKRTPPEQVAALREKVKKCK